MSDAARLPHSVAPRPFVLLIVFLAGCTAAGRTSPTRAMFPLGDAEIQVLAELVRLEDRRDFDEVSLRSAAGSPHPEVRRRAAMATGRIGEAGGVTLLLDLLEDADTSVAATAAFALGLIGDTVAVSRLAAHLSLVASAQAPTVAAEAASALGKLSASAASTALAELLRSHPQPAGRAPVAEHALLAVWRHPRGADPTPILAWTAAPHPEVRWRATYALVRRPDPAATPRLIQLATDPEARVRALAVRGLTAPLVDSAGLQVDDVLTVLVTASHDADYATVINSLRSLGTYSDPQAIRRLTEALRADPHFAITAAESLGRVGPAAASAASELRALSLQPENPLGLRAAALQALTLVSPSDAEVAAAQLAQEFGWRGRGIAGRAYAALSAQPRPVFLALIRDPDPRVGAMTLQAAVEAAGEGVGPLRDVLLEAVGAADVQLRTAALTGLGRLRDASLIPVLLDALERAQRDTVSNAALAALDALASLREVGAPAGNALVQRFPRPVDYLLRQRAVNLFGDPVRRAWGDARPIETEREPAEYEAVVRSWVAPALGGRPLPRARIETASGMIELELFAADAPLTVESFARLAERGYFDGQEWPRVVPNFVIQGGDPRGDQSGGPGYAIRDELNRHRYGRGTLGMALSGPDTGGSQFFVTHSAQPHLDGGYTVFGEVVRGMEVVDRVLVGERIHSIRLVP